MDEKKNESFEKEAEEIVRQYFDIPVMRRDGNDVQDLMDRVSTALARAYEQCRKDLDERNKKHNLHDIEHCLDVEADLEWSRHKNTELWNSAIEAAVKVVEEDMGKNCLLSDQLKSLIK